MNGGRAYSFRYLLSAAQRSHDRAVEPTKDRFLDCMSVLLYSALATEAFLNHVGPEIVRGWNMLQKKLSPAEKLELIFATRDLKISWGEEPYQSFAHVFKFRNLIAHADTQTVEVTREEGFRFSDKHWQSYATFEIATRVLSQITKMVDELPGTLGIEHIPRFLLAEHVGDAPSGP